MSSSEVSAEMAVEVVYEAEAEESSEEPPMEEWSSLEFEITEENVKKTLFEQGLYEPAPNELCAEYVAMSDSAVFIHPYYNYPSVPDPGIKKALFDRPIEIIYPDDGQELYAAVCDEMNQSPVRIFQRGLLNQVIDLKYYCVNPFGVRAMAMALQFNRQVKVLDLTENFLNDDACYHLGQMLTTNSVLHELNLSGCMIGSSGLKFLVAGLNVNRALKVLNLNRNKIGDEGVEHLGKAIFSGIDLEKLYLSRNDIGSKGASVLAEAFETHNKFVVLDFSWNNLFSPVGVFNMLSILSENKNLKELYLSWNGIAGSRLGLGIKNAMSAPNLQHLDLSNNKLFGETIKVTTDGLTMAKKLVTLDLSFNPMTVNDGLELLKKLKKPAVKVQKVIMKTVVVNPAFVTTLESIKQIKSKRNLVVIYGDVKGTIKFKGPDPREVVLNRADYLSKKQKKRTSNLALVVLQIVKNKVDKMPGKDFYSAIQSANVPLDPDLVDEIVSVFAVPRTGGKVLDVISLADYIRRKWPDEKLPPTPPPEPEPQPPPKTEQKGGKGKK